MELCDDVIRHIYQLSDLDSGGAFRLACKRFADLTLPILAKGEDRIFRASKYDPRMEHLKTPDRMTMCLPCDDKLLERFAGDIRYVEVHVPPNNTRFFATMKHFRKLETLKITGDFVKESQIVRAIRTPTLRGLCLSNIFMAYEGPDTLLELVLSGEARMVSRKNMKVKYLTLENYNGLIMFPLEHCEVLHIVGVLNEENWEHLCVTKIDHLVYDEIAAGGIKQRYEDDEAFKRLGFEKV